MNPPAVFVHGNHSGNGDHPCSAEADKKCAQCGSSGCTWNEAFSGVTPCGDQGRLTGFGCGKLLCHACCKTMDQYAGEPLCRECRNKHEATEIASRSPPTRALTMNPSVVDVPSAVETKTPPAKKRKRQAALGPMMWTVTFTHYQDDYKPRGGDWASTDDPVLFSTKKKAKSYLRKSLIRELEDNAEADDDNTEEYKRFFCPEGRLRAAFRKDLAFLKKRLTSQSEGEFIQRTLSWELTAIRVDAVAEADSDTEENIKRDREEDEQCREEDEQCRLEQSDPKKLKTEKQAV